MKIRKDFFELGVLVMLLMGAAALSFGAGVDPLAGEPEGERIVLWPEGLTPNAEPHQYANPFIEWFVPSNKTTDAVLVLTCGGGYGICNWRPNGLMSGGFRDWLLEKGMTVVRLHYRTPRPKLVEKHMTAWQDAQRAVRLVRAGAAKHGVAPDKIGFCGYSAAGHLALLAALSSQTRTYEPVDAVDSLPCNVNWAVPAYPAYILTDGPSGPNAHGGDRAEDEIFSMFKFDAGTCPVFFMHGDADGYSSMASVKVYSRLHAMHVPAELHVFAKRDHDFKSRGAVKGRFLAWRQLLWDWLLQMGIISIPEVSLLPQPKRVEMLGGKMTLKAQADIRWIQNESLPKEGYRLKVSGGGVEVAYADASARVHALQTLRQLAGDTCRDALVLTCPAELPCCEIEDSPKFPWRGYMLDTSRHFFGTDVIKRALDAMAYHKLNVFHWHLIDGGGWRFPVSAYPDLTDKCATRTNGPRTAAWGRNEQIGKYGPLFHSREDIAEVLAYAKARGIEVVPEVDIPGHQGINGVFRFACCQSGLQPEGTNKWHGATGDMCVGNPDAYRFYEKVFDELCEVFPSKVIHIGGDEVGGKDWARCPRCLKIMRERGLKNQRELQNVVMRHFAEYLAKKGRRAIGWDEILEGGEMPPQTMMTHFHSGGKVHLAALAAGHDVVMMPGSFTYFDCEQDVVGDPYDLYQVFNGRQSWKVSYSYDPCAHVPEKDRAHVLGLQGCSWTEILCNEKELDWSVYPRLCCLAETGWSYPAERDADAFEPRLSAHRERLVKMGINAAPLGPLKPWIPAIEPKPDEVKLRGFAVVFAPRVSEESVTWIDDKSIPPGGCAIEISAVPYYKPGKIEVRHSDAAGKALALKALVQIATPKNTGVFYIPKGTIRYGCPRNADGAASRR